MANFNKVILLGNLTKDPEVRYTPSGTAVSDLSLAVNESFKNREGETVERTCFVDVVVWARQAETCGQYLKKGSPILVEGRLQQDKWENDRGETRTKLRVRADRVQFLGSPRGAGFRDAEEDAPEPRPAAPAPAAPPQEPMPPPPMPEETMVDEDNLPF